MTASSCRNSRTTTIRFVWSMKLNLRMTRRPPAFATAVRGASRRSGGWGARGAATRTHRAETTSEQSTRRDRTELERTRGRRRARLVERASVEARAPRDESERHRDGASGSPDPARAHSVPYASVSDRTRDDDASVDRCTRFPTRLARPNAPDDARFIPLAALKALPPVIRANLAHAVRPRRGFRPIRRRRPARAVRGADRRVAPGPAVLRPR